ncbi:MAG: rhodanese-like domain-containing protein [Deltaproteobacteria bacterium]|nr:rhodanese-like domain-containing protein [Deltaproteobacteria bacterium]
MIRFLLIVVLFVFAWELLWWTLGVAPLSPWRLKRMLSQGVNPPILLDVRTAFEYNWMHIEGAIHRPHALTDSVRKELKEADRPVVVICFSGHRSPIMGYLLMRKGLRNVSYLSWGMLSWYLSGGPVIRGAG